MIQYARAREGKLARPGAEGLRSRWNGHAVMAELVALRSILLNALLKLANGHTLTAEEMQRLIRRTELYGECERQRNRYAFGSEPPGG